MKPSLALRAFLYGSALLAASTSLHAANRFWDGTDTTANADGGNGNWNTANTNWDNAATAGGAVAFGASGNVAVFGGTAGTVTMTSNIATTSASGATQPLTFNTSGYIIDGDATRTLSLHGGTSQLNGTTFTSNVNIAMTGNNTWGLAGSNAVNGVVSGAFNLVVGGSGTLVLANTANTFSGILNMNQGTVEFKTIANVNGGNSSLGNVTTAGSTITLGNASNQDTALVYSGTTNSTSDRGITLGTTASNRTASLQVASSGNLTLTSNFTINNNQKTLNLGGNGTGIGTISGNIPNIGNALAVTKTGTGTWVLSGTNGYATNGNTTITGGNLIATTTAALDGFDTSGKVIVNGGTVGVRVGGAGWTNANVNTLLTNATKTSGFLGLDTTNANFTQATAYTATNLGGLGINKLGTNTLILGLNNSYTGATTVSDGTLRVNGSHTGGGTYTVAAAGTLQGTGSTASAMNVSGVLSPGASIETFGSGTLNMLDSSTFAYEVDSSESDLGLAADLQKVTGDLNLSGTVTLDLTDLATLDVAFANNTTFSLINYTGDWNDGLFTFGGDAIANGDNFTAGLNTWRLDYDATSGGLNYTGEYALGNFVNITAVPEPGAALLGSFGLLALLRRRRA